jgi:hypothetical protein
MHNCKLTDVNGRYTFLCSRCKACYVCKHKAIYFDDADKWMWKCKTGKFVEVILDGRLNER